MAVNPLPETDLMELEQSLMEVEQCCGELRARLEEVKSSQLDRAELLQKYEEIKNHPELGGYKTQLQELEQRLEQLELTLESKLFNFTQLQRPFWWIIRFGGGGILLGWWLNVLTGG